MKIYINKTTLEPVYFAETIEDLIARPAAIDCTTGLHRYTDKDYRLQYIETPQTEFPTCEDKYKKLVGNIVEEMTEEEKDKYELDTVKANKLIEFNNYTYRISIELDELEDNNSGLYKNLQKMFKWCESKKTIYTDALVVDDNGTEKEYMFAHMNNILTKHQTLIDNAVGAIFLENVNDDATWIEYNIVN